MEQQRVFLAIALSIGVLLLWQVFFGPSPEDLSQPAQTTGNTSAVTTGGVVATSGGVTTTTGGNTTISPSPAPQPVAVEKIDPIDLPFKSKDFEATITNVGGRLKSMKLIEPKQYKPRGDLMLPAGPTGSAPETPPAGSLEHLPFTVKLGQPATLLENAVYKVASKSDDKIVLVYDDPAGRFSLERSYLTNPDLPNSFLIDLKITNKHPSIALSDALSFVIYGQQPEGSGEWSLLNPIPDVTESVCSTSDGIERAAGDDAAEKPTFKGPIRWGSVDSRYFTAAIIAPEKAQFASCAFDLVNDKRYFRTELTTTPFNLAPGATQSWTFTSFVGPKSVDLMERFDAGLERTIDYGIFEPLCRPIRWLLVKFHGMSGNWGIAIILLTVLLRMILLPVNHKSYKSMEGMRRIQEPMQEIKKKYDNDPMKMQEEMMKLYKTEGVSPFGCLPQLLQIPIFFALYRTIYSSVELYHASFFAWYTDLSAPDPYYVLPVLVGVAMFGQQFLMPNTAPNPQMKYVMYAMPVMFSLFTFVLPAGLALYICVSVGLGIAQQFYIRRSQETEKTATA